MPKYVADFETTTDPADTRVWAWAVVEIGNIDNIEYGNSIYTFSDWLKDHVGSTVYFHNLKFDGQFIVDYLLRADWEYIEEEKFLHPKAFTALISDMGQWYDLKLCFSGSSPKHHKCVTIYDSLKLLPFSVEKIAKAFNLEMLKGEIDYTAPREFGHLPTDEEIAYIHNDVCIVAQALQVMFSIGMTKMTIGSNALNFYKTAMGKDTFLKIFPPPLTYDRNIRQSYRGGWTYVNPDYADKDIGEGIVLDVNSLYPSQMKYKPMPYGVGMWFKGQYKQDYSRPLYIQHFRCAFEIKPGFLPTVQIHYNPRFKATEYVTSSNGEIVDMCMTSVDLKLFLDHYDVYSMEYESGWSFKAKEHLFDDYIDYWTEQKIKAKQEDNGGMYTIAKLFLNNLYGKFSTAPTTASKHPRLEDGEVKYSIGADEERDPVYLPVGTFITAYARDVTIRAAQKVKDRFLYADTDSLHLIGTEVPADLDVDDYRLGAWKLENRFRRGRYLHAKCYLEDIYNEKTGEYELKPTIAGLPAKQHSQVNFDNFHYGAVYTGKLLPKKVVGGVVLTPHTFEIKKK